MNRIEELFNQFQDAVSCLQEALNVPESEALTETFDNLENKKIKVEMGAPDQETVAKLRNKYDDLRYDQLSKKEKVQIFTLLTLKAINDEGRDANQMPTPPILSTVMTLFMSKLLPKKEITLVDPAVGSGNLLFSAVNQLISQNHSINRFKLVGIDNDEGMLNLADVAAHLSGLDVEFYCQDALTPWLIPNPEAIISDLPIGYYPVDDNAENFALKANNGHSYAHMLYIEQIIKNLAPDGYAFLLVPNSLLTGKIGADFMPWLANKVYLQAIVELPSRLFKNKVNQKSVLVFQNHGQSKAPKEVLVTKIEDLRDEESLVNLNIKLNEWYTKNDN